MTRKSPVKDPEISGHSECVSRMRRLKILRLSGHIATVLVRYHRYDDMGVSINGGIQNGWFIISWEIQLKWMIWGYPYFRKPPYVHRKVPVIISVYTLEVYLIEKSRFGSQDLGHLVSNRDQAMQCDSGAYHIFLMTTVGFCAYGVWGLGFIPHRLLGCPFRCEYSPLSGGKIIPEWDTDSNILFYPLLNPISPQTIPVNWMVKPIMQPIILNPPLKWIGQILNHQNLRGRLLIWCCIPLDIN